MSEAAAPAATAPAAPACGGSGDKKDKKAGNRQDEELEIDMVDDESLTEAVLARVVERLLSKK